MKKFFSRVLEWIATAIFWLIIISFFVLAYACDTFRWTLP